MQFRIPMVQILRPPLLSPSLHREAALEVPMEVRKTIMLRMDVLVP
jgi:hypothetical protein